MKGHYIAMAATGLAVGIVLATILVQPAKSVVVIPEGSSDLQRNFEPQTLVIGRNNTVVWINQDVVAHLVVSNDGYVDDLGNKFDSTPIMPGKSFQFTFTRPGTYEYHSEPHPWMHGKVVVLN